MEAEAMSLYRIALPGTTDIYISGTVPLRLLGS